MSNVAVRSARVTVLGVAVLFAAACGGGDGDDGAPATAAPATAAPADGSGDEAATDPPADEEETVTDTGIDWATVDLTTVDWANIDLSTIDTAAIEGNPTVANLSAETLALIQARFADEQAGGEAGSGRATLTIGDETWEFDGFVCARGYEMTQSEVFSFSSNAFGTLDDGTRTQLQANVWDESGSDSLTGPQTDHEIIFDDIDDFDNPAVKWLMTGTDLTFAGTQVSVDDATFRDLRDNTELPGSFVGDCGPGSRL